MKVWDSSSVEESLSLRGHTSFPTNRGMVWATSVSCVQFSPDGEWLVSGSEDHTIRIWRPSTGEQIRTLPGHTEGVRSVAFSPDGTLVASASEDKTARVWDMRTGKAERLLKGHERAVWAVAFDPDGKHLATGSEDKTIRIWDLAPGGESQVLAAHDAGVTAVTYSRDGRWLASGSLDGTAKIWDTATNSLVRTIAVGHAVRSVAFSPDSDRIATASDDQTLRVWKRAGEEDPLLLRGHTCNPTSVEFSADGTRLISASPCDFTVRVWDTITGQEFMELRSSSGIEHAVLSPDGMQLAGAAGDGTVKIWDARPMTAERETQREARGLVAFLFGQRRDEKEVLSRIREDATISDAARQQALELAGPYGRTLVETEAHRLVQQKLAAAMTREQAKDSIRSDPDLWAPVRRRALDLVAGYEEDAIALLRASLPTVMNAGGDPSHYARALRQVQSYCRLKPDDPIGLLVLGGRSTGRNSFRKPLRPLVALKACSKWNVWMRRIVRWPRCNISRFWPCLSTVCGGRPTRRKRSSVCATP